MFHFRFFVFFSLVGFAHIACASQQPALPVRGLVADQSAASTDGPHVFFRGRNIVVKWITKEDSVAIAHKQVHQERRDILLTCVVEETGDAFSFALQDSIATPATEYALTPDRILVLSDIEGNFAAMKSMLLGAGVINEQFEWIFGNGHLVLLGDYFDRGLQVTECLWLAYKLENEAREAGGMLHFINGNHEVMNMSGDIRYVRNKYIENAELIREEYVDWYGPDSELGRWLRTRNAVERIGDQLFCHGGISPQLAELWLRPHEINQIARKYYGVPEKEIKGERAAAVFDPQTGIFWYRDMAKNKLETTTVLNILQQMDAKRIVLGHTLQADITAYYNQRVICVDLYHEENQRKRLMKTLLIENGTWFVVDSRGGRAPITEKNSNG